MTVGESPQCDDHVVAEGRVAPTVLIARLVRSPVLSKCSRQEIARLLPFLRERRLQPGETLCFAGQPTSDLWLVLQGTLRLKRADESIHEVSDGVIGEEAALGISCYLSDIVAVDQVTVVAMGKEVTPASLTNQNRRAQAFGRSLIRTFAPSPFADAAMKQARERLPLRVFFWRLLGWIAAVVSPVALLRVGERSSLRWEQQQLAAVLVSTGLLWMFRAVSPYVAGLLIVLVCVTLGIVPTAVVLSGFASNGFFLALSIFCLGAVLIESGAIDRAFLLLIKYSPRSAFSYDIAALLTGFVLTPVVSSAHDRVRVLAPLAVESAQTLGYQPGSRDRTRLTLSMFMGLSLFSPMFLTGSPLNLILYGSLPEQIQDAFPGLRWTVAALAATVVMLGAFLATYFFMFRRAGTPRMSRPTLDVQLDMLGPVRPAEWLAVGGVLLFLGAVATVSAHKVDYRLLALAVVCGYLVLGVLGKEQLNLHIDWSELILLGTLIGAMAAIVHVNLHVVIGAHLVWLDEIMKYRPRLFVALLAASVVLGSFVVPLAGALIGLYAVPLAMLNGMNPWVVIFVILLMSEVGINPSPSEPYRAFRSTVRLDAPFDEHTFLRFNTAMAVARVVALAASVVYWEWTTVL